MIKNFLLYLLVLTSLAAQAQQTISVTENFDNVPLSDVLKTLRTTYHLKIAYDNDRIKNTFVTLRLSNAQIEETFSRILSGTNLTFQMINNKIIIIPKPTNNSTSIKPISLTGIVTDSETGETLPNALIRVVGVNQGTVSNTDGFFTLHGISIDTVSIQIDYLGYHSKIVRLEPASLMSKVQVKLISNRAVLNDVTIIDIYDSPLKVNEQISKVAFNPASLSSLPSLGEQDLFRSLQLLPGVSGTNESSAGMVVRGSNPSHNLIQLDGFTIYHLDHFFGVFSGLNSDIIKDVQIYKSGYEANYGGRVSGVVDITGKSGNTSKPSFHFGANLISVRATAEIPIGERFSLLFAARRAYTDVIQSNLYTKLFDISQKTDEQLKRPINNERFAKIQPSFYFYDVNAKFTYKPSVKDILSFSLYASKDHLFGENSNSQISITPPVSFRDNLEERTDWGNNGASLRWGRQWNSRYYTNVTISGSDFFRDYGFKYAYELDTTGTIQSQSFRLKQNNAISDGSLTIENELLIGKASRLNFGFSAIEHMINYKTLANATVVDEREDTGSITSLYATLRLKPVSKLSLSMGGRINYHEINDKNYIEPRANLSYQLTNQFNLKAAYGKYYQFVNQVLYDDPYNGIQNFWAFSNKDGVPTVSSHHYVAGATYRIGKFTFDLEAYYKDLDGVVEFNPAPFFINDQLLSLDLFVNGKGRMRGIEFLAQKEKGKHKGWISYTLSRSLNAFPSVNNGTYYSSPYDQTHELKIIYMVTAGKWDFSANWIYGTGRPYPGYNVLYFRNSGGQVEDFVVIKDRADFQRLPDYHRLDMAMAYNFDLSKIACQAGLSIFNAYGRQNVKTRKLDVSSLTSALGSTAAQLPTPTYRDLVLIGFTPSVFVSFSF